MLIVAAISYAIGFGVGSSKGYWSAYKALKNN
jgi:hypothetical protein